MKLAVIVGLFACLGCALTKDGRCVDYQPLTSCPEGSFEECVTTSDGCEQCGCVAARNGRPPGIDDRR